jgi:iron(III) transport system substrate-binding protein
MLAPIKPVLMLPEVVDQSKWWGGRHRYYDTEREYVFIFVGMPVGMVYYNTQLVDPREFKSLWDFVNPTLRGKLLARDVRVSGPGGGAMRFFYHHPELGPKFIRQLFGHMDITIFRDLRQGTDWLARGKFPICFFCADPDQAKRQGLPVERFDVMKEGSALVAHSGSLGLMNQAPHPSAAKVFMNWFLSREGQVTLQKTVEMDSLRTDIPKDHLLPHNRRSPGADYMVIETSERTDMAPILKVLEEALAEAEAKKKLR